MKLRSQRGEGRSQTTSGVPTAAAAGLEGRNPAGRPQGSSRKEERGQRRAAAAPRLDTATQKPARPQPRKESRQPPLHAHPTAPLFTHIGVAPRASFTLRGAGQAIAGASDATSTRLIVPAGFSRPKVRTRVSEEPLAHNELVEFHRHPFPRRLAAAIAHARSTYGLVSRYGLLSRPGGQIGRWGPLKARSRPVPPSPAGEHAQPPTAIVRRLGGWALPRICTELWLVTSS